MRINHQVGGHSHIRLPTMTEPSFGPGKHLGENHHKLAIPALNIERTGKENARHQGGPAYGYAAAARPRRHIPGVTP
jgi:hypothetical protein